MIKRISNRKGNRILKAQREYVNNLFMKRIHTIKYKKIDKKAPYKIHVILKNHSTIYSQCCNLFNKNLAFENFSFINNKRYSKLVNQKKTPLAHANIWNTNLTLPAYEKEKMCKENEHNNIEKSKYRSHNKYFFETQFHESSMPKMPLVPPQRLPIFPNLIIYPFIKLFNFSKKKRTNSSSMLSKNIIRKTDKTNFEIHKKTEYIQNCNKKNNNSIKSTNNISKNEYNIEKDKNKYDKIGTKNIEENQKKSYINRNIYHYAYLKNSKNANRVYHNEQENYGNDNKKNEKPHHIVNNISSFSQNQYNIKISNKKVKRKYDEIHIKNLVLTKEEPWDKYIIDDIILLTESIPMHIFHNCRFTKYNYLYIQKYAQIYKNQITYPKKTTQHVLNFKPNKKRKISAQCYNTPIMIIGKINARRGTRKKNKNNKAISTYSKKYCYKNIDKYNKTVKMPTHYNGKYILYKKINSSVFSCLNSFSTICNNQNYNWNQKINFRIHQKKKFALIKDEKKQLSKKIITPLKGKIKNAPKIHNDHLKKKNLNKQILECQKKKKINHFFNVDNTSCEYISNKKMKIRERKKKHNLQESKMAQKGKYINSKCLTNNEINLYNYCSTEMSTKKTDNRIEKNNRQPLISSFNNKFEINRINTEPPFCKIKKEVKAPLKQASKIKSINKMKNDHKKNNVSSSIQNKNPNYNDNININLQQHSTKHIDNVIKKKSMQTKRNKSNTIIGDHIIQPNKMEDKNTKKEVNKLKERNANNIITSTYKNSNNRKTTAQLNCYKKNEINSKILNLNIKRCKDIIKDHTNSNTINNNNYLKKKYVKSNSVKTEYASSVSSPVSNYSEGINQVRENDTNKKLLEIDKNKIISQESMLYGLINKNDNKNRLKKFIEDSEKNENKVERSNHKIEKNNDPYFFSHKNNVINNFSITHCKSEIKNVLPNKTSFVDNNINCWNKTKKTHTANLPKINTSNLMSSTKIKSEESLLYELINANDNKSKLKQIIENSEKVKEVNELDKYHELIYPIKNMPQENRHILMQEEETKHLHNDTNIIIETEHIQKNTEIKRTEIAYPYNSLQKTNDQKITHKDHISHHENLLYQLVNKSNNRIKLQNFIQEDIKYEQPKNQHIIKNNINTTQPIKYTPINNTHTIQKDELYNQNSVNIELNKNMSKEKSVKKDTASKKYINYEKSSKYSMKKPINCEKESLNLAKKQICYKNLFSHKYLHSQSNYSIKKMTIKADNKYKIRINNNSSKDDKKIKFLNSQNGSKTTSKGIDIKNVQNQKKYKLIKAKIETIKTEMNKIERDKNIKTDYYKKKTLLLQNNLKKGEENIKRKPIELKRQKSSISTCHKFNDNKKDIILKKKYKFLNKNEINEKNMNLKNLSKKCFKSQHFNIQKKYPNGIKTSTKYSRPTNIYEKNGYQSTKLSLLINKRSFSKKQKINNGTSNEVTKQGNIIENMSEVITTTNRNNSIKNCPNLDKGIKINNDYNKNEDRQKRKYFEQILNEIKNKVINKEIRKKTENKKIIIKKKYFTILRNNSNHNNKQTNAEKIQKEKNKTNFTPFISLIPQTNPTKIFNKKIPTIKNEYIVPTPILDISEQNTNKKVNNSLNPSLDKIELSFNPLNKNIVIHRQEYYISITINYCTIPQYIENKITIFKWFTKKITNKMDITEDKIVHIYATFKKMKQISLYKKINKSKKSLIIDEESKDNENKACRKLQVENIQIKGINKIGKKNSSPILDSYKRNYINRNEKIIFYFSKNQKYEKLLQFKSQSKNQINKNAMITPNENIIYTFKITILVATIFRTYMCTVLFIKNISDTSVYTSNTISKLTKNINSLCNTKKEVIPLINGEIENKIALIKKINNNPKCLKIDDNIVEKNGEKNDEKSSILPLKCLPSNYTNDVEKENPKIKMIEDISKKVEEIKPKENQNNDIEKEILAIKHLIKEVLDEIKNGIIKDSNIERKKKRVRSKRKLLYRKEFVKNILNKNKKFIKPKLMNEKNKPIEILQKIKKLNKIHTKKASKYALLKNIAEESSLEIAQNDEQDKFAIDNFENSICMNNRDLLSDNTLENHTEENKYAIQIDTSNDILTIKDKENNDSTCIIVKDDETNIPHCNTIPVKNCEEIKKEINKLIDMVNELKKEYMNEMINQGFNQKIKEDIIIIEQLENINLENTNEIIPKQFEHEVDKIEEENQSPAKILTLKNSQLDNLKEKESPQIRDKTNYEIMMLENLKVNQKNIKILPNNHHNNKPNERISKKIPKIKFQKKKKSIKNMKIKFKIMDIIHKETPTNFEIKKNNTENIKQIVKDILTVETIKNILKETKDNCFGESKNEPVPNNQVPNTENTKVMNYVEMQEDCLKDTLANNLDYEKNEQVYISSASIIKKKSKNINDTKNGMTETMKKLLSRKRVTLNESLAKKRQIFNAQKDENKRLTDDFLFSCS
ncbi:conserved Plasmodium protein, unknown function [Plasmodium chabaudi chabaudi]|uniref:Uncharacterized protein n=1 Tax=Plasmodium chabaudi chabaudi TaxID=31271 RepID=A0A4V0K8X4_PLACU|nr:conserved Plasmodium protein, unknown function [Plasmodium chabaudi chabaudi]VTZ68978.1 conserved Plasmodium protein, unknown function [Plasmodium chabaudi chabaudi]|eukprot:XP_739622.2 conserved Plasmodium protein, unknown function [Plasmodium chabaudi chabaudi]